MSRSILIVEDEPLIAKDLSFILEDMGIQNIAMELNYADAEARLLKDQFDLVLLDVNLSDEKDGIDLAHFINENVHTPFIFITSYFNASTVARAKVTHPIAYLIKPFNKHDIRINVEMALYKAEQTVEDATLYIREKAGSVQLKLSQIKILEAQDNYTKIVGGEKEIIASLTLKSILEKLPEEQYVRTHKSFAVRLEHISLIKGGYVYIDDSKVPIGRSYKGDFQKRISIL